MDTQNVNMKYIYLQAYVQSPQSPDRRQQDHFGAQHKKNIVSGFWGVLYIQTNKKNK